MKFLKNLFKRENKTYTYPEPITPLMPSPTYNLSSLVHAIKLEWEGNPDDLVLLNVYEEDKWIIINFINVETRDKYTFVLRTHKKSRSLRAFTNDNCWFNKKSRILNYFGLIRFL